MQEYKKDPNKNQPLTKREEEMLEFINEKLLSRQQNKLSRKEEEMLWKFNEKNIGPEANKKMSIMQKNSLLMERSPDKWKTAYRDQYRNFSHSPEKKDEYDP